MSVRRLAAVDQAALASARMLSKAGLLLLIVFAFATLVDGLARNLFNQPIDLVRDVGELVVAVAVSSCFPQAFLEKRNIVIAIAETFLGRASNRVLELVAAIVTWIILALFAWQFYAYARELATAGEITFMLQLPKAPFWYVVDANLWLACLAQTLAAYRQACTLFEPQTRRLTPSEGEAGI